MARTRPPLAVALPPRSGAISRSRIAPRHRRAFGRARTYEVAIPQPQPALSEDLKQFLTTFVGALVFVSVLIA